MRDRLDIEKAVVRVLGEKLRSLDEVRHKNKVEITVSSAIRASDILGLIEALGCRPERVSLFASMTGWDEGADTGGPMLVLAIHGVSFSDYPVSDGI